MAIPVYLEPPKDIKCTDHKDAQGRPQPMSKVCRKCKDWIGIEGDNPNTGRTMQGFQCAKVAMVLMQLETTQMIRQMDAGVTAKIKEIGDKITGAISRGTQVQIAIADEQRRIALEGTKPLMLQEAKQ